MKLFDLSTFAKRLWISSILLMSVAITPLAAQEKTRLVANPELRESALRQEAIYTTTFKDQNSYIQFHYVNHGDPKEPELEIFAEGPGTGAVLVAKAGSFGVEWQDGAEKPDFWRDFAKKNDLSVTLYGGTNEVDGGLAADLIVVGEWTYRLRVIPIWCLVALCPEYDPDCCRSIIDFHVERRPCHCPGNQKWCGTPPVPTPWDWYFHQRFDLAESISTQSFNEIVVDLRGGMIQNHMR